MNGAMDTKGRAGLRWFRARVHVHEGVGNGWYACWHIVARDEADARDTIMDLGRFIDASSVEIDSIMDEDEARPSEIPGIKQEGGRIFYDESTGADESTSFYVQLRPWGLISKWRWRRTLQAFNDSLRSRGSP